MAKLEYDEDGRFFGHFCIALFAVILLPLTYYLIRYQIRGIDPLWLKKVCKCNPCNDKRKKMKKSPCIKYFMIFLLISLWCLFAFSCVKIKNTNFVSRNRGFNPYDILGIDSDATPKEIKSAYRKLVLVKHPDRGGDVEEYIEISKAYKALTDETARENYEKYGNPDGPPSPSLGIALPSWLIDKKHSKIVLLGYFMAIILGLPIFLSIWWYRSKNYYSDKLLQSTVQLFVYFMRQESEFKLKRIITILSGVEEFTPTYSKFMSIGFDEREEIAHLAGKLDLKNKREGIFNLPYSVKARVLLYSQLNRLEISKQLQQCLDKFLVRFLMILNEFQNVLCSFYLHRMMGSIRFGPCSDSVISCMKLSSCVIQAQTSKDSPLIQLPHVSLQNIINLLRKKKNLESLEDFVKLSAKDRELLFKHMSESDREDVVLALEAMPHLTINIKLRVGDELNPAEIEEQSFISVIFILKRQSLHSFMLSTNDSSESMPNGSSMNEDEIVIPNSPIKKQIKDPLYFSHSPLFSVEKKEGWWAYILNEKDELVVTPYYFSFSSDIEIFEIQLYASQRIGQFKYKCFVLSDSYCNHFYTREISLNIVHLSPDIEYHPQWQEISDDEYAKIDDDVLTDNELSDPLS